MHAVKQFHTPQFEKAASTAIHLNRENRIRTCDPLVPNQVLYQTELFPEKRPVKLWPIKNAPSRSRTYNLLIRSQTLYPVALWVHINILNYIMPRTGIEPVR